MKVVITGANGLVGANLSRELLKLGHQVKALYYNDKKALQNLDIETVRGNILDKDQMNRLMQGAEVVFHAAAKITIGNVSFEELYETNVTGTQTVYQAAKANGVKTFIHYSSIHALQQPGPHLPCSEDCPLALESPFLYEKTKAIIQQWLVKQKGNGMRTVILNPTAIVGPNDFKPSLIGQFIIDVMKHKLPALVQGGYDWVDVRDVVQASINALEKGKDGEHYILSGKWESLISITQLMEKISGEKYRITVYPLWMAKAGLPFLWLWSKMTGRTPLYTLESLRIINHSSRQIHSGKAKKELGFSPRPLEKTLKDTMEWFKQNNYV